MYYRDNSTTVFMTGVATGLVLGALAMFIFDPQQGRRRRALARDKMVRYTSELNDFVSSTAKDLGNRAYGVGKETQGLVAGSEAPAEGVARPL